MKSVGDGRVGRGANEFPPAHKGQIDQIDLTLMRLLRDNSRMKGSELCRKVGLKHTALHRRIKNLRDEGHIRAFTIDVDEEALGYKSFAYVILRMSDNSKKYTEVFCKFLFGIKNVLSCEKLFTDDFIVKIGGSSLDEISSIADMIHDHELCGPIETHLCKEVLKRYQIDIDI